MLIIAAKIVLISRRPIALPNSACGCAMGICYQYDCDTLLQKGCNKELEKIQNCDLYSSPSIGEAIFLIEKTCSTHKLNSYGVRLGTSANTLLNRASSWPAERL